jgi:hypothetical protein
MERCPVCGVPAPHAWGVARENDDVTPTARLIGWHTNPSGRGCWAADYSVDYARAIGRIREQGGERLRLAAHP